MEYGELADRLGLKLAKQEWSALLDLVAGKTKREVGYDVTWNVVYASGPAKRLGRYFSTTVTRRRALHCSTQKTRNKSLTMSARCKKCTNTHMH